MVDEKTCAACDFNRPESNCQVRRAPQRTCCTAPPADRVTRLSLFSPWFFLFLLFLPSFFLSFFLLFDLSFFLTIIFSISPLRGK